MAERHRTAERLIEAGLVLFAERGIDATPIVKIEAAAGLAPGSGAFYKHFRSKQELLDAAIADATVSTATGTDVLDAIGPLNLTDQATLIARGTWAMLDTHRELFLVLHREHRHRPWDFGDDPTKWPGSGPAAVARWLAALTDTGRLDVSDPDALAVLLLDGLVAFWRRCQTDGDAPQGIDKERIIAAWIHLVVAMATTPSG